MATYGVFTPAGDPARPAPAKGSAEALHVIDVITHSTTNTLMPSGPVLAWNHRDGDVAVTPGWYLIGSGN